MKKIFGLILSAAVLGTVLTACGGSGAGVSSSGAAGASEPASVSGSTVNSSVYGTTLADIQAKANLSSVWMIHSLPWASGTKAETLLVSTLTLLRQCAKNWV